MPTIHWLGAGLSSAPGIRRLAAGNTPLILWNRTASRAAAVVAGLSSPPEIRTLDLAALAAVIRRGDVLVSMLPADMHLQIARLALDNGAHFVSSSYIAPEMLALHDEGQQRGLCLVNEVGLDPGIDHLLAHRLLHQYRPRHRPEHRVRFRSWCGGFPALPNDFRYKFSWSPVGVLRALRSPSRCLQNGRETVVQRPWLGLSRYDAELPAGRESFEAYANRDSLPFIAQYGFDPSWQVEQFVRGTLRLDGWSAAWQPLFEELESLEGEAGETRLQEIGAELWRDYAYAEGEADRVVLCVELEALEGGKTVWHGGLCMDARGNDRGSAMGRLVSHTVSLAVDSVLAGELATGVSAAPSDPAVIDAWFAALSALGDEVHPLPGAQRQH